MKNVPNKAITRMQIRKEGQRYVDEPVYLNPLPRPLLDLCVAKALGGPTAKPPTLVRQERVVLNWIKPEENA